MSTLLSIGGSLDDIVFEGRNQAYGAFQLRRSYQRHLGSALAITTSLCALLLLLPLALRYFAPPAGTILPKTSHDITDQIIDLTQVKIVQPKVVQPPAAQRAATAPDARPATRVPERIVPDEQVQAQPETAPTTAAVVTGPLTAGPAEKGVADGTGISATTTPGEGLTVAPPTPPAPPTTNEVMLAPEVMPGFIGGPEALRRYLQKHLHYPAAALAAQATGRVYVSFTVQTDGSIADVQVLKGLGYGTEEAAARVVREMPAWQPGKQNHRPVAVRFTLPIVFHFE